MKHVKHERCEVNMKRDSISNRAATCALRFVLVAVSAVLFGCAASRPSTRDADYRTIASDPRRDTDRARQLNDHAADLIEQQRYDDAETTLKQALSHDVMFGPAHNNLGLVYFHQRKLYVSAWEFQYAAKLLPHQAEPRNNLGLVFEAAGRLDDAVDWYEQAHQLEPDNPQLIGNTARARLKRGDKDAHVRDLLQQLVLKDTRPQWIEWARERLSRMRSQPSP